MTLRVLPGRSPTVGLICASARRTMRPGSVPRGEETGGFTRAWYHAPRGGRQRAEPAPARGPAPAGRRRERVSAVAVFGSSRAGPETPAYSLALSLGRALARRGVEVRCGGYGGVMEAVSRGAREAGGRVVGCTLVWPGESRSANPHLSEEIPCTSLDARIAAILEG